MPSRTKMHHNLNLSNCIFNWLLEETIIGLCIDIVKGIFKPYYITHGFFHVTMYNMVPSSWKLHVAKRQTRFQVWGKHLNHTNMHGSTWLDSCLGVVSVENKACKTWRIWIWYMCFLDFVAYEFEMCRCLRFLIIEAIIGIFRFILGLMEFEHHKGTYLSTIASNSQGYWIMLLVGDHKWRFDIPTSCSMLIVSLSGSCFMYFKLVLILGFMILTKNVHYLELWRQRTWA